MKSYIAPFETEAAQVMENVEAIAAAIIDEGLDQLEAENPQFASGCLFRFSRRLRYLLAQLAGENAGLAAKGNIELNCLETRRLLSGRLSIP